MDNRFEKLLKDYFPATLAVEEKLSEINLQRNILKELFIMTFLADFPKECLTKEFIAENLELVEQRRTNEVVWFIRLKDKSPDRWLKYKENKNESRSEEG